MAHTIVNVEVRCADQAEYDSFIATFSPGGDNEVYDLIEQNTQTLVLKAKMEYDHAV